MHCHHSGGRNAGQAQHLRHDHMILEEVCIQGCELPCDVAMDAGQRLRCRRCDGQPINTSDFLGDHPAAMYATCCISEGLACVLTRMENSGSLGNREKLEEKEKASHCDTACVTARLTFQPEV
eukprot:TRINITY_DN11386_c0_g1_i5.p1 TRINITY_DN11386_c0_g1~~TRINITY_DN11386_c0_g1_i5.p1  ORF type:complete len:123 (-),score=11.41 TRINITY_DN11386_c0_g1_i5:278-646(-)